MYSLELDVDKVLSCVYEGKFYSEEWKDIKDYEGTYKVSSFGRVRSLDKLRWCGRNKSYSVHKGRILSPGIRVGYKSVYLYDKKGGKKNRTVHSLVFFSFNEHDKYEEGMVINHKDIDRLNNFYLNLEMVTQRENSNMKHIKSSSKYVGVTFYKNRNNYRARISFKYKTIHLGAFKKEIDAHLMYQKALKMSHLYDGDYKKFVSLVRNA